MRAVDFFNLVNEAIAPDFRKPAEAGYIVHKEIHHDGRESAFSLKASAPFVAFSMDVRGKEPLGIINSGRLCARNDLTVICLDEKGNPLVFLFEYKNSTQIGDARFQLECGPAFCEYLFRLLQLQEPRLPKPRFFAIAVYRLRQPPKGTTRPQFSSCGNLTRAYWDMGIPLPLTELIRAAQKA